MPRRLLPLTLTLAALIAAPAAAAAEPLPLKPKGDTAPLGAHQPARQDPLQAVARRQDGRPPALEHRGPPPRGLRRPRVPPRRHRARLAEDPHPRPPEWP